MPIPSPSRRLSTFALVLSFFACGGIPTVDTSGNTLQIGGGGAQPAVPGAGGVASDVGVDLALGGDSSLAAAGVFAGLGETAGAGSATVCGNGLMDPTEGCDDGNAAPGDGCDGLCRVEFGYQCNLPGESCVSVLACGDAKAGPNEACDDGNLIDGDGCSKVCAVEQGYVCSQFGSLCTKAAASPVCGNGSVEAGENCDDAAVIPGDGCSSSCQMELGYLCPKPGQPCQKNEYCGDGILNLLEQCDDGNLKGGDCCTGSCQLEPNCVCLTPVPGQSPPRQICTSTVVCGDSKVTGNEICDDGAKVDGDGCSADCGMIESGYSCPGSGGTCSKAVELCGNAKIDAGEECDDGQMPKANGDGCSADCRVETGYVCPVEGKLCKAIEFCGDGKISFQRGESCDDGINPPTDADGCSALCRVESGYRCTGAPSVCKSSVVCGDKKILGNEICDDGNARDGDGCSATCQIEAGYQCPIVGIACQATCGDGKLGGREQCDDGNAVANDGCSPTCVIDTPTDSERDAWLCPTPGAACQRTVCGNGVREGSEQCDDGDNDTGDGCSPFCRKEPTCPATGGACSTACGDAILLPIDKTLGQECDDGNTVSGDGCSADCKVESGYACIDEQVSRTTLMLPIVLRDFKGDAEVSGHPDFENYNAGWERGIVQDWLDSEGKPQHVTVNKKSTTNDYVSNVLVSPEDYFARWYRDTPTYNKTIVQTLTFGATSAGIYEYRSSEFFPLNGLGWGNYGTTGKNFHFTSEVRYWFEYRGGESLRFTGDDDVWVFVNRQLAVDLGGVHSAISGSITLNPADGSASVGTGRVCENATTNCTKIVRLGLEIGKVYEIVVFQAERHTTRSNYLLTLGNFTATRSSCTPVCGDGVVTATEQCDLGQGKNLGGYGGCGTNCLLGPYCGDKIVDASAGEVCDDGSNSTPYGAPAAGCAPDCKPNRYCGDQVVDTDFGEACDLGTANSATAYGADRCLTNCLPAPFCGDGKTNGPEACDDGLANGTPASGCSTGCQLKCGNGVMDAGEQCDQGSELNNGVYGGCRANCTLAPYCGDGYRNGAEQCDDGKNDGTYGTCRSGCTLADYCGDGQLNMVAGEHCDNGPLNSVNQYGRLLCTNLCQPAPFCGDNAVDASNGELCDDGANNSDVVPGACKSNCSGYNTPAASCGNGRLDAGEECDDGSSTNGTVQSACDVRCQLKCGNGIKDFGELCDDGVNDGSYGTCGPDCSLSNYCGDGIKNGPEQCDLGLGNEVSPYGAGRCTKQCTRAPQCGDGRLQPGLEDCDGQPGCSATCHWVAGGGTIL